MIFSILYTLSESESDHNEENQPTHVPSPHTKTENEEIIEGLESEEEFEHL